MAVNLCVPNYRQSRRRGLKHAAAEYRRFQLPSFCGLVSARHFTLHFHFAGSKLQLQLVTVSKDSTELLERAEGPERAELTVGMRQA